ncbi:hypothetical protein KR026_009124 [Drosophila bipectinata]|nr:hypothetical protein KR026_009124 [Drosophila bipectinata]
MPLFVLAALATVAFAFPEGLEKEIIPVLKSEINKRPDGSYDSAYETANGIVHNEEATIQDKGTEDEALEIKGSYKYINDLGEEVEVFYTAGKNGFVPYGTSINPEITAVAEAAKDLPKLPEKSELH